MLGNNQHNRMSFCLALAVASAIVLAFPFNGAKAWGQHSSAKTYINFRSAKIDIVDPVITIADVATVRSTNSFVAESIKKLDLDEIKDASSVKITSRQVLMRIRLANLPFKNVQIGGPDKISVSRTSIQASEAPVKTRIVASVAEQFGLAKEDVRVSITGNSDKYLLAELVQSIDSSEVVLPTNLPLGPSKVRFLFRNNEGLDRTIEVSCRITVFTEMLMAKKFIPRGSFLDVADFKVVKRPMDDPRLKPAVASQVGGKKSRKDIPQYGVLQSADLEFVAAQDVVRRNDLVSAIVELNGVRYMHPNAKVLTAGGVGDRVEVLNTSSQRKFVATVVNSRTVKVR
ncbi:MAG: flagellar basal body P-ring formation chaperone FlgA [Planctomycetota bacterium]